MSSNKEYQDFLKFLYFEGYVDSYEEAEELVEYLSDDEIEYLCEARLKRRAHTFPLKPEELESLATIRRFNRGNYSGTPKRSSSSKTEPEKTKPKKRTSDMSTIIVAQYLFDEGYADSPDGAKVMSENISRQWMNEIIEKFNPTDYEEYYKKTHRERNQSDEWDAQEKDWQDSQGDIRDKHNMARGVRKKKGAK